MLRKLPETSKSGGTEGMTLIELMVGLALLSLVLLAVHGIHLSAYQSWFMAEGDGAAHRDLRMAVDWLMKDVRGATKVEEPGPGESGQVLKIFSGGEKISYYLDQGTLWREPDGEPARAIIKEVASVDFALDNTGKKVKVELAKARDDGSLLWLKPEIYLRNGGL